MAHLEVSLLGPFQATLNRKPVTGFESNKVRALLAYLMVEDGRPHSRDVLAALLWPDQPQRNARNNLRYALADLRQNISDAKTAYLSITRETIQFNHLSECWLDVLVFRQAVEVGGQKLATDVDLPGAIDMLKTAIRLSRGSFLEGFSIGDSLPFDEWLLLKREQFSRLMSQALKLLADYYEQCADLPNALIYAREQVEFEPWNEESHQQIMRLLALDGQRSAALVQYETCQRILADELGVEPSANTVALYNQLLDERLTGDLSRSLLTRNLSPIPGEPPYKGLQYFDLNDADRFFGRELLIGTLVNHLREMLNATGDSAALRFLAVVGASGSGKSSLVRAGMVPAICSSQSLEQGSTSPQRNPEWEAHIFAPTSHPLEVLNSLPFSATAVHHLLVVDQFEELFTLCHSEVERRAFLEKLLHAAHPNGTSIVVIAMRADFYAHCAGYPQLRNAISARQVYIGAMDVIELQRAIEGPAIQAGWMLEPGLVDLILRDAGEEPGALPLLSHALLETWHQREGRLLTLKGYITTGGVGGAIAKTAETFYTNLPARQKRLARNIFLRLTDLGDQTQETRRRAALEELFTDANEAPQVNQLLTRLADARLVTLASGTVEVAHEALIREWPTLRGWLAEDQAGMRLRHHISLAAQTWQDLDRDPAELYRGNRLTQALVWAAQPEHSRELNLLEKSFLKASQVETQRQEEERQAEQRRLDQARQIAHADELTNAALSSLEIDPERSLLLALESLSITETSQGLNALHQAFASTHVWLTLSAHDDRVTGLAFNPQGTLLASAGADRQVKLWDFSWLEKFTDDPHPLPSPQLRLQLDHPSELGCLAFIPGVSNLVTACEDDITRIWDIHTGQLLTTLPGSIPACNSDGLHLAAMSNETLTMWTTSGWNKLWEIPLPVRTKYKTLVLSPDNMLLAAGYPDGSVWIWDASTGKTVLNFQSSTNSIWSLSFDPTAESLAVADGNGEIHIHNATNGKLVSTMLGRHNAGPKGVTYTPDGKRLISSAQDGKAKLWDAATGKELYTLHGHNKAIDSMALHPSGAWLATGGRDGTLRLWNLTPAGNREVSTRSLGHAAPVIAGAVSQDWQIMVTVDSDLAARLRSIDTFQTITSFTIDHPPEILALSPKGTHLGVAGTSDFSVWDTGSGKKLFAKPYLGSEFALCFNADGTRLMFESGKNTAKVVRVSDGDLLLTLSGHTQPVKGGAFSPDDCLIATASEDKTARLWRATDGKLLLVLDGHTSPLARVTFSPDSQQVATTSQDATLRLWDCHTGTCLRTLAEHTATVRGAYFSPDGTHLATLGYDGKVIVWDTTTWSPLHTFSGSGMIYTTGFSPDGRHLFIVFSDQTIHYYAICTRELIDLAQARLTRSWTNEERKRYLAG